MYLPSTWATPSPLGACVDADTRFGRSTSPALDSVGASRTIGLGRDGKHCLGRKGEPFIYGSAMATAALDALWVAYASGSREA